MAMKKIASASPQRATFDLEIENLLHPAQAFEHPLRVVEDPDLTLNEKRAIIASWASDACAIEAAPALRQAPGTALPVRFDDVLDALLTLDQQAGNRCSPPPHSANKIVVITGGTSGIGLAASRQFIAKGATVRDRAQPADGR
jgi:hypothetical protein